MSNVKFKFELGVSGQDASSSAISKLINPSNTNTKQGLSMIIPICDEQNVQMIIQNIEKIRKLNPSIQCIFICHRYEAYNELTTHLSQSVHIVTMVESNSIHHIFNKGLDLISRTHAMLIDTDEYIDFDSLSNELASLDSNTVYPLTHFKVEDKRQLIDNKSNQMLENTYFNSIFDSFIKEEIKEQEVSNVNPAALNHDVSSQSEIEETSHDSSEAFVHPYLNKIVTTLEDEKSVNHKAEKGIYPKELIFERLLKLTGIIIPSKMFSMFKLSDAQDIEVSKRLFAVEVLTASHYTVDLNSHCGNVISTNKKYFNDFTSRPTSQSALYYLKQLNNILNVRQSFEVTQFIQYEADKVILYLKNLIEQKTNDDQEIIATLKSYNNLSYSTLNKGEAKELVIAYCFPPYIDTSGNVMAKRIAESGEIVDIISNKMDRIRKKDDKLIKLADNYIDTQFEINAPQAFSSWGSISQFTAKGLDQYNTFKHKYSALYSRAMFPASHFLAFEIKRDNPNITWTAEFSDPLHTDVSSNLRYAPIDDLSYVESVKSIMPNGYQELVDDNVFNVCELISFAFADRLIFTNDHQLEYMIERFDPTIQQSIRDRAIVTPHPTPSKESYEMVQSYYSVAPRMINLAYFGNFYDTRGFREIELVCKYLVEAGVNNFMIHVFTNVNSKVIGFRNNSTFKKNIKLNPFVDYFEFLNLTNKMDALLIFDAHTIGIKEMNPYLPSKLSDYIGSKALTWAFVEEGSILSKQQYDNLYITHMNEFSEYANTFKRMNEKWQKSLYKVGMILCNK
ncbi:hypothetical protein [Abyssicoccus albus]|uniref:hypothetical protein n=1 Tax=Abyssicoccus albus TaxID=1817405 RepID=UPI00097E2022|nr:hypothetical protein [Abyssicoccus albus]AQL55886.1 hypothetical protein BVH56_02615 [Abyssicoccus albus]